MDFVPERIEFDWPQQIQHVSASSMAMALRCPEQWRQRYVLGRKQPPALALISGTADHKAIAADLSYKMDTGQNLSTGEVIDRFVDALDTEIEQAGGVSEMNSTTAEVDQVRDVGIRAVRAYHQEVCPTVSPVAIEEEFTVQVPGLPVPVIGYIDLRTPNVLVDRKTARRAPDRPQGEWQQQAAIYQLAYALPFEWHVSVKTKVPQIIRNDDFRQQVGPAERTERMVAQVFGQMGFLYQQFGPDEAWPTNGTLHNWACNYCGYKPDCAAWR